MAKIFITGCAKSGTTLVRRLMNAFDLNVYNAGEITLRDFVKSEYEVGKRDRHTIFSDALPERELTKQLQLIVDNGILVIDVVRNRQDVLKSSNGYVSPSRYDVCKAHVRRFEEMVISYQVDFDRLLKEPDTIQLELSTVLKLKVLHKWSDFPKWANWTEPNLGERYRFRKIGA